MNKEFIRVRSAKDIIITILLLIGGSICVAIPSSQALNVTGFVLIFAGLLLLFIMKTGYKDTETGLRYCKSEHYFAQSSKDAILAQLKSNPTNLDMKAEDNGNGLRLDIYRHKSGLAYYQLFEYIPYKYEPCSSTFEVK